MEIGAYRIKAVLFDFDGTLTRPGVLDFKMIKKALACPSQTPVLEFIRGLEDDQARHKAEKRLESFELEGARKSKPNTGAQELLDWIKRQGLKVGIITRNSISSVRRSLENFDRMTADDFDLVISRDDPPAPKPSGEGILWAARKLGVLPREMLVIGDFVFDIQAGQAAGALTVLLDSQDDPRLVEVDPHFRIHGLEKVMDIIRGGLPLPAGKLPNAFLKDFLQEIRIDDPAVLIHPRVGEDVAAVDIDPEEVIVLKSDPVTFATDAIGQYSVLVNANDIATAGARPRWFLTTLLLPRGVTPSRIHWIMKELADVAGQWDISLCGGHTEITDAVSRPVVVGMMAGTVRRNALIDKRRMDRGDCVLVTKGVAVEGTAIIAREFETQLHAAGLADQEIASGRGFLDRIAILPEARLAARDRLATALHDVTEGGLATALEELSLAGGHKIAVDLDKIPVFDLTRKMCSALGLDPLGLIGSGSLLICCRPEHCDELTRILLAQSIPVTRIGRVLEAGTGIEAFNAGEPAYWKHFEVDEITKLF